MPTRINRESLLHALEAVSPGLCSGPQEIIEQSKSFIFQDGQLSTFNDEVCCRVPSPLGKAVTGAVPAEKLLELLRELGDDELLVEATDGDLRLSGKGWKSGVRMEAEILLDLSKVERPKKDDWQPLHEDFADAVGMVAKCASTDQAEFDLCCVHLTGKWVEASDRFQLCRWRLPTGLKESALVREMALKPVATLGLTEFSETQAWLHFRGKTGLVYSCRRYLESYRPMGEFLKVEGEPIMLPKSLLGDLKKARIFSMENGDDDSVLVELRPGGGMSIKGEGISGWYRKSKKGKNGVKEAREFLVSPELLGRLIERHGEAILGEDKLLVKGGSYSWVTCLTIPGEQNGAAEESEATEGEE